MDHQDISVGRVNPSGPTTKKTLFFYMCFPLVLLYFLINVVYMYVSKEIFPDIFSIHNIHLLKHMVFCAEK